MSDERGPIPPPRAPGPATPREKRVVFESRFGLVLLGLTVPLALLAALSSDDVQRFAGTLSAVCLVLGAGVLVKAAWRGWR